MNPASSVGPFTWSDFVALDEADPRELIDGELVEVEVPTDLHEYIVALLAFFLTGWARPRRAGFTLVSGYKVRIDERRGVMPDVQFYRAGNTEARRQPQALEAGHPDLAVEVVSESSVRYDRVTKLAYYGAIGVPEYWIVDAGARTLDRFVSAPADGAGAARGGGAGLRLASTSRGAELFRPESFAGLEIPLADLWEIPEGQPH
jgi:Uma2 family endonuclease